MKAIIHIDDYITFKGFWVRGSYWTKTYLYRAIKNCKYLQKDCNLGAFELFDSIQEVFKTIKKRENILKNLEATKSLHGGYYYISYANFVIDVNSKILNFVQKYGDIKFFNDKNKAQEYLNYYRKQG